MNKHIRGTYQHHSTTNECQAWIEKKELPQIRGSQRSNIHEPSANEKPFAMKRNAIQKRWFTYKKRWFSIANVGVNPERANDLEGFQSGVNCNDVSSICHIFPTFLWHISQYMP